MAGLFARITASDLTQRGQFALGDRVLEDLGHRRRRPLAPELVDEPVAGDELVRVQKQVGEERLVFAAAERDTPSLVEHLEWAKDAKVHPVSSRR
jgi:hypothetical protein